MASEKEINDACSLLETDVLRHIVALKMIGLYGRESGIVVRRDGPEWGVLALLPVRRVQWDRRNYAGVEYSAFVDGSRPGSTLAMLDAIPRAKVVVKSAEPEVGRELIRRGATHAVSILSFTTDPEGAVPASSPDVEIRESLDDESAQLFAENGYESEELVKHFKNGARRFSIREAERTVAACFVFENYKTVWEVGGVRTVPDRRGRGLAKKTASAALRFLSDEGLAPRYQTVSDNTASVALARSLGLALFLTQEHYVWERS
ncbi:MAG: GNAT family N-acetyltransferase [Spirochaetales bacterium]|nr:GNAT family N-acetyltransferase [Spirochaetales bacterium]